MQLRRVLKTRMNVGAYQHKFHWAQSDIAVDMIIDNDPPIERHISVPRDMNTLSCSSFTAGVVEAVLDGLGFVSFPHVHRMPLLTLCSLHG